MVAAYIALVQQVLTSSIETVGLGASAFAPVETTSTTEPQGRYDKPTRTRAKAAQAYSHLQRRQFEMRWQRERQNATGSGMGDSFQLLPGLGLKPDEAALLGWDPLDMRDPPYTYYRYKVDFGIASDYSLGTFEAELLLTKINQGNLKSLKDSHLYVLSYDTSRNTARVLGDRAWIATAATYDFVLKTYPLDCGYKITYDGLNHLPWNIKAKNLHLVPFHGNLNLRIEKSTSLNTIDLVKLRRLGYGSTAFTHGLKSSTGTLDRIFLPHLLVLAHELSLQVTLIQGDSENELYAPEKRRVSTQETPTIE